MQLILPNVNLFNYCQILASVLIVNTNLHINFGVFSWIEATELQHLKSNYRNTYSVVRHKEGEGYSCNHALQLVKASKELKVCEETLTSASQIEASAAFVKTTKK